MPRSADRANSKSIKLLIIPVFLHMLRLIVLVLKPFFIVLVCCSKICVMWN